MTFAPAARPRVLCIDDSLLIRKTIAMTLGAGVELLSYGEIGERRCAGGAMGQVDMSRLNPALLLKYSESATLDPYAVSGAVSMSLFQELMATA